MKGGHHCVPHTVHHHARITSSLHHCCHLLDGVQVAPVLNICLRYQRHLSEVASVIANAQVRYPQGERYALRVTDNTHSGLH